MGMDGSGFEKLFHWGLLLGEGQKSMYPTHLNSSGGSL
jgi:hypothetical protein